MLKIRQSGLAAIVIASAWCAIGVSLNSQDSLHSLGRAAQPEAVEVAQRAQGVAAAKAPPPVERRGQTSPRLAESVEALAKKSGCFQCHHLETHVVGPAFREIAARYERDVRAYDLRFMSVASVKDLPEQRQSTVIVARVGDKLHVRIFDAEGRNVVDKAAAKLADGVELTSLEDRLITEPIADGSKLPEDERSKIIERVSSIAGYTRGNARDALIQTVTHGGKGNWTAVSHGVPMPPFSKRLSDAEIRRLIDWVLRPAGSVELRVLKMGLGSGSITSTPLGIDCGGDCAESYARGTTVTLTAAADPGSSFVGWEGDAFGMSNPATLTLNADASVRAIFRLDPDIPPLTNFTPEDIRTYLTNNPIVNTPARFIKALPEEYKHNWILMTRSESLQTGTAEFPRLLLPSADARFVFTIGLMTHGSYPGAHPNAIEFMQWDATEKNFRFHELVLDAIPAMGVFPDRTRGVSFDDSKCSKCHSTQNVLNRSSFPGTTGIAPPFAMQAKNKPNWDTYDSWGGMTPFNRDRIYQGSVEAAAFRRIMNPWTWSANDAVRSMIEQLELQPPDQFLPDGSLDEVRSVPREHVITRTRGGTYDGHINFAFDASPPVLTEPAPTGTDPAIATNYSFNGAAGTGAVTSVTRGGAFLTLHHSSIPTSDEGRGVRLFDALGGLAGNLNRVRIADELVNHRFATGSVPIDIRPIALAISKGLVSYDDATETIASTPALPPDFPLAFFDARNGMGIKELVQDTRDRAQLLPRHKADLQKLNLHRTGDVYLQTGDTTNGLVQQYGAATSAGTDDSLGRLRGEVFRRPIDLGFPDSTVMGGVYVDRELYSSNTAKLALFRYFLEPLGVSVDKWSMGVRGRSRTYTFADVFDTYFIVLEPELRQSLIDHPVPGLTNPDDDAELINAIVNTLSASTLPPADEVPKFTDVQRIFNKSCIECHGGLDYPPYSRYSNFLDLSEDESPPPGSARLDRSHARATAYVNGTTTSLLYRRLTQSSENCPSGLMPCGGPALSTVDVETIRRWILGGAPYTVGDPHLRTIGGVNYDFQAAGEFLVLRGEGLQIQARQMAVGTAGPLGPDAYTGLTSCVSVNSAVAVRIGRHRITYQPKRGDKPAADGLQLRVDGKPTELPPAGISLATGGRILPTIAPGGVQIEGPGGTVITITPGFWEHYQVWYLHIDTRHARATEGLMGVIPPGNWLPALPDGKLMGPRPASLQQRHKDLYETFGNAWRVTDTSSLFDYEPGASTTTFTVPTWPGGDAPNGCTPPAGAGGTGAKEPQKPLTKVEAARLSAEITDPGLRAHCIQDLTVTGEKGFVRTYLMMDQIRRNRPPTAPVLESPSDHEALQHNVTFSWKPSTDADGDPVTYRYYVWPVNAAPNTNEALAIAEPQVTFRTVSDLKPGQAYFWKIIAEDNKGGTAESETRRLEIAK